LSSNKIYLDKYYTSEELADYCINKTYEIIGTENITEVIEPSAGNGSFSNQIKDCIAYDIEPEGKNIIKQDFLSLQCDYKKGRLIIGNPPYGSRNTLSVKFYKKSIQICDYISFILPISQFNNNMQMYEFDLVYSEDLGINQYSGRPVHCCLNIYERNNVGLNKKPRYKLNDVEVLEYRRNGNYVIPDNYDFAMCSWGSSIGKEIDEEGQYAQESYILIKNDAKKDEIINVMKNTDWKNLYPFVGTPKIQTWKIVKYLSESVKDIA